MQLVVRLPQATRSQAERQGRRLGPLITNVNPQVFQRPTFRLFLTLLDNYKRCAVAVLFECIRCIHQPNGSKLPYSLHVHAYKQK